MKYQTISLALGQIDSHYVQESAQYTAQRMPLRRALAAAACLVLLLLGVFALSRPADTVGASGITVSAEGVAIPQMRVGLSSHGATADMLAFFIYGGRSYVAYDTAPAALKGSYLGTASGSIDEWTSSTDYVELSGSIGGDFFAVAGYDPAFLLCMDQGGNQVMLYINDNGITLKDGADLFAQRLHLAGNYTAVTAQTRDDWYYSRGVFTDLTAYTGVLDTFVDALNNGAFVPIADILPDGVTSVYDSLETHHLFFDMADGTTIHLRLFRGGYVQFAGIGGVCVQMDVQAFDSLVAPLG